MLKRVDAIDEAMMRRALVLAEATVGLASPNPQVGCVLARDGRVIGAGAHVYDRYDHAEIVALKSAEEPVAGATAYVTLEPCSHHGRTGPCADALVAAGIARCVVATADPNPQVSGRGIAKLRAAGIEVEVGLLEREARALNDAFALSITRQRPFVTLKAGVSVDGFLAPPASQRLMTAPVFLTGAAARGEVQQLRHAADALITGIGTVLADDPSLTDRSGLPRRRPLLRVVLDSELRLSLTAKLLDPVCEDVAVFCALDAPAAKAKELENAGARVVRVASAGDGLELRAILAWLHNEKIISALLEAGSGLNAAFLREGLVDRAVLYYAEAELGLGSVPFAGDGTTSFALEQRLLGVVRREIGPDVCVSGLLWDPWLIGA